MAKRDNGFIDMLISLMRMVAEETFKIKIKDRPKYWVAEVLTASIAPNSSGQVYLNGDTSSNPITVRNKSWETVSLGDEVYLFSPTGKLTNSFIEHKK